MKLLPYCALTVTMLVLTMTSKAVTPPNFKPLPSSLNQARETNYKRVENEYLIPFWQSGITGTFSGEKQANIHYRQFIHPKAKAKIVIVHGYSENLLKYQELAFDFYGENLSVYLMAARGHGKSQHMAEEPNIIHVDCRKLLLNKLTSRNQHLPSPTRIPKMF